MKVSLKLSVSEKVGKRARAVEDIDYVFSINTLINGFLVCCRRPLDAHQIASGVDESLVVATENVINDAYNILYGEENDQE